MSAVSVRRIWPALCFRRCGLARRLATSTAPENIFAERVSALRDARHIADFEGRRVFEGVWQERDWLNFLVSLALEQRLRKSGMCPVTVINGFKRTAIRPPGADGVAPIAGAVPTGVLVIYDAYSWVDYDGRTLDVADSNLAGMHAAMAANVSDDEKAAGKVRSELVKSGVPAERAEATAKVFTSSQLLKIPTIVTILDRPIVLSPKHWDGAKCSLVKKLPEGWVDKRRLVEGDTSEEAKKVEFDTWHADPNKFFETLPLQWQHVFRLLVGDEAIAGAKRWDSKPERKPKEEPPKPGEKTPGPTKPREETNKLREETPDAKPGEGPS